MLLIKEYQNLKNKKEEANKIHVFQGRLIRNIQGIKWNKGNRISNDELYQIADQTQWSKIVAYRRLRFFGYIARLDDKTPFHLLSNTTKKRPRRKQTNTLL